MVECAAEVLDREQRDVRHAQEEGQGLPRSENAPDPGRARGEGRGEDPLRRPHASRQVDLADHEEVREACRCTVAQRRSHGAGQAEVRQPAPLGSRRRREVEVELSLGGPDPGACEGGGQPGARLPESPVRQPREEDPGSTPVAAVEARLDRDQRGPAGSQ